MNEAESSTDGLIDREGPFEGPGGQLYHRSISPATDTIARLAIVHGYGDHSGRHLHFMRWMAERGIACDAVDLRGQGRAQGRRGYVRQWEDYLDDLQAFLSLFRSEKPLGIPLFVLGHSHGGLVVAAAGESGILSASEVRGVIMTSPYLRCRMKISARKILLGRIVSPFIPWLPIATGMENSWMTTDPAMVANSVADPLVTRIATPRWYLRHLRVQQEVIARAPHFHLPLLVLAAGDDRIADPTASEEFVKAARSIDKTFHLFPEMRHELLREMERQKIFAEIRAWVGSH